METKNPSKILVVDDDPRLRDLLRRYLGEQGFNVYVAENAPSMNKLWVRERFDLLVLDLMLPGEDGLSICRRLRGSNDRTPIIMLTAKGEDVDRIVGLEMGADDYLPKPFNPRELVARIHAVLRRQSPSELPGAPSETTEVFEFGEFALNLATRTLTKNAQEIPLTTGEWLQWGNPKDSAAYVYMKSYSPYDNVAAKAYPAILVTTGLNDPRVGYWEPAKWVAKLRATKTDSNLLIMKTNMGAGHGGASGRYDALRDNAFRYAFVLDQIGATGLVP